MFDPGLKIGQVIENSDIVEIFKCGNMGGMRRSKVTNTLVLVSDYTKGIYHDKWIGGILHYTGMGKIGNQDINRAQNKTLANYKKLGVDVHLFEVIDPTEYIYCGRVELVSKPYEDIQTDEDGKKRKVWIFPIKPNPENNVKKPKKYVYKDMEDYKNRNPKTNLVDPEPASQVADKNNNSYKPKVEPAEKELVEIPKDIIGKKVKHKKFGLGTITEIENETIKIQFDKHGLKLFEYKICVENNLLKFI